MSSFPPIEGMRMSVGIAAPSKLGAFLDDARFSQLQEVGDVTDSACLDIHAII